MSRQDANAAFARTSFLYGGNADYIEDLYARYESDPKALDAEWQAFFQSLKDDRADVVKSAQGPSWQRPDWPQRPRGELVSALDADWAEVEKGLGDKLKARAQATGIEFSPAAVQQATRDSIHALMLIRA
jgi:2-oxoglutarate dehydrogenase E1 component